MVQVSVHVRRWDKRYIDTRCVWLSKDVDVVLVCPNTVDNVCTSTAYFAYLYETNMMLC